MPIYEYRCLACRSVSAIFYRSMREAEQADARCARCGGTQLERLVSRVNTLKSEERKLEELASPELMQGLEQEDPRALAQFMRRMGDELGEPMDDEMNSTLEQWESGASFEESSPPPEQGDAAVAPDS